MWKGILVYGAIIMFAVALPTGDAIGKSGNVPWPPITRQIETSDEREARMANPCYPLSENRKSDLCAQWKAADATRDSADWTVIAFIVGTVLNLVALTVVGFTFRETRKATAAAMAAAERARETLWADRAWITSKFPKLEWSGNVGPGKKPVRGSGGVSVKWENTGRSPAINVRYAVAQYFQSAGHPVPTFADFTEYREIPALGVGSCVTPTAEAIPIEDLGHFANGELDLYFYSRIEYEDLYEKGVVRVSEVSFKLTPHFVTAGTEGNLWTSAKTFNFRNSVN